MQDPFGSDAMVHHSQDFKADAVISFHDVWMINPNDLQQLKVWIPWVPIDKSPIPPNVIDKLRYAYKIITMSRFGQRELEKKGFASTLILEGTDTEVFKPMDREACRKELGLPQNKYLFAMIAANKENPPRKGFQEAVEAFKMFHDKHPDSAIIFSIQQPGPGGFPIKDFGNYLGLQNDLLFVQDYKAIYGGGSPFMAQIYNAANAHLHPSQTEGFGLTVIEHKLVEYPVL